MGRAPCCDKNGLKKGPWTPEEDQKLIDYIQKNGHGSWRTLPKNAGLSRCGKSCRLRWTNYLRPDIKRGRFSFDEEETIIQLHSILGNKWSAIAARLPGRTDNEIKNYWNTHIRKRLLRMGIDPVTHAPRLDLLDLSSLLNPVLYNPAQLDLQRLLAVDPLVNSELLRLASTILQSQCRNASIAQAQHQLIPPPNFMAQNVNFSNPGNFDSATNFVAAENSGMSNVGYGESVEQDLAPSDVDAFFDFQIPDMTHDSVLSTPASSPTLNNSCSTYFNSSAEDDRDSYCSANLFNFEIPDLLDEADFLQ